MTTNNEYCLPNELYDKVKSESETQMLFNLLIKEKHNVLLTGGGGVGKTYLIKRLMEMLEEEDYIYYATASTGTAARQLHDSATTINRYTGLGILQDITHYYRKSFYNAEEIRERIRGTDILILDEGSMISANFLDVIIHHLHEFGFSGRILMIADFLQLPPVVDVEDLRPEYYLAFQSRSWDFIAVNLNRMHRTDSIIYTQYANEIRFGHTSAESIEYFMEKDVGNYFNDDDLEEDFVRLFATNSEAKVVNDKFLSRIEEEEHVTTGIWVENKEQVFYKSAKDREIKRSQNMSSIRAEANTVYKLTEKVMIIVNKPDSNYNNGDIGTITKIEHVFNDELGCSVPSLTIKTNYGIVRVTMHEFKFEELIGKHFVTVDSFYQLPIIPAYAITTHKSQGMTIDKLFIDFNRFFAEGQSYVALSRVSNPDNLLVRNFRADKIFALSSALWFYHNLTEINQYVYSSK